jgi:protein-disulfide isomerase
VFLSRHHRVLLALSASLLALACSRGSEAAPPTVPAAAPRPAPAAPPPAAAPTGEAALSGIPGMDFSALPPSARRELATVFSDEFCYCGCPHTLGQCLRSHTGCQHARRMARLAARRTAGGMPATEVILGLSQYYASFRQPRATLTVDGRMCMGDANAPVTLVEFSDFECPYCARARPVLESFAQKNASRVRFCYVPFPLASHPNAVPAGQAVLWARDQGKFWQMHDALFEHQEDLSPSALVTIANGLGLKGAQLRKALEEGTYAKELDALRAMGRAANVRGTPAVFFNGRLHDMGFTEEDLTHSLEDELEWRANGNAWAAD